MHLNTLSNALPIVAAAYGRKFGVSVLVGGDQAATDGNTIRIPAIRDDPTSQTLAWGYLTHEAGHVRHTDFAAWHAVGQPLTKAITNILEDVRIENAMIATYPGARQTLDGVLDWMIEAGEIAAPTVTDQPPMVFANALLVLARHQYRKQKNLEKLAQESNRVLREVYPKAFAERLIGLMTEIGSLKTTADAASLAKRMVDLIKDEAKPKPQPQPSQKPKADDKDSGMDHEGDSASTDTEASQSQAKSEDSTATPKGTTGDAQARASLKEVLAAGADDLPADVFETVAEALGTKSQSQHVTLLPTLQDFVGNWQQGRMRLAQANSHSAKLATRLQGLVQAHTRTKHRTVRCGRTLSSKHLHRVAVGDSRIFARKDEKRAPNTALHLLVDLSGSMVGGNDDIALEAAMALALALEPIKGVSRAVTAFPGLGGADAKVTRILAHGDRVSSCAGSFVQYGRGSTPMTGALWFAAADLISRKEERKVILTLTDGGPDDWHSAAEMIGKASVAGIEMIGIGIQQDVGRLFPVAIRIASVADLKGELFRIAERLLLT